MIKYFKLLPLPGDDIQLLYFRIEDSKCVTVLINDITGDKTIDSIPIKIEADGRFTLLGMEIAQDRITDSTENEFMTALLK